MQILLQRSTRKPAAAMDEIEGHTGDPRWQGEPRRSDLSLATELTEAPPQMAAGALSVRLLAARAHDEHAALLIVRGEIDLGTVPLLRNVLLPVLERETGAVVVDLSEVPFMDSTGVHVLVDTLRRLESQDRPLVIVCDEDGQVHRLLALVGLLDALPVYHSRESAIIAGDGVLRSVPSGGGGPA
jgi:anti-sigma B factor antagonist